MGISVRKNATKAHAHLASPRAESSRAFAEFERSINHVATPIYLAGRFVKMLNCGKHYCAKICHEGLCGDCKEQETIECYCEKDEKTVDCGKTWSCAKICAGLKSC